ncbi:hypothetical protein BDV41DRAFT_520236 [Aspergillus transmontanensis]|uniref:Glucose-methanol-choline oxidoreductase C-terminal domain-containing protein n=1 Tax=Aspergillus transmontanensis TaxID=1034304 RepID=A0A5N6WFC6_9EURO|nr:hypothetical protein BDV41DRAFT_520236 [Aspergillus transmontanensis]
MEASLGSNDLDLVSQLSAKGRYDFVIVGSGVGGGILARLLVERNKSVLLIEKGRLLFSTHCLNTSRPSWQVGGIQGPSQDNDVVYNNVKRKVQTTSGSDPYVGGPVHCLGGRSSVWGLFAPRERESTLKKYFPERITKYLQETGYESAFNLMTNHSKGKPYNPKDPDFTGLEDVQNSVKKGLEAAISEFCKKTQNTKSPEPTGFEVAPIAAEFKSTHPYRFPQGAYSTIDALLNLAYAGNHRLTILMNTEALFVTYEKTGEKSRDCPAQQFKVKSLTIRALSTNRSVDIMANEGFILCAGTIETARIALLSGLQDINPLVGKGLTDHEIWGVRFNRERKSDAMKHPLKLQCEVSIGEPHDDEPNALLNVVVNANNYFGRSLNVYNPPTQNFDSGGKLEKAPNDILRGNPAEVSPNYDTVNVTLQFAAELLDTSEVLNFASRDPVIHAKRHIPRGDEECQKQMQCLATIIRNKILNTSEGIAPRLSLAGFGAVAHEVGTMRLEGPKTKDYVVDKEYHFKNFEDLYICDLSIFPVSPPANPTLTLAALAMQLADDLCPAGGGNPDIQSTKSKL